MLIDLIAKYHEANRVWQASPSTMDDTQAPEWLAFELAEEQVLFFPCHTIEDIRQKAAFVLGDNNAFDTVKECTVKDGPEACLAAFLRSLLGESYPPVDNTVDNGEKP